jgi:hypothetical protein
LGKAVKPDSLYRDVILDGDTGKVLSYELGFRCGRHVAADNLEDNIKLGASKEEKDGQTQTRIPPAAPA